MLKPKLTQKKRETPLVAGFADPSDIVVDASDADLSYYVNLAAISAFNHYSELSFVALVEGKKKKKKNLL